jgi:hypothetical protein
MTVDDHHRVCHVHHLESITLLLPITTRFTDSVPIIFNRFNRYTKPDFFRHQ